MDDPAMTDEAWQLLLPYKARELFEVLRFNDAPPPVARQVLSTLEPYWADLRPNGQPPFAWLVDIAERLGGTVGGDYGSAPIRQFRLDLVCVPGEHGRDLVEAVLRDWPDDQPSMGGSALDLALGHEWSSWDATEPNWEGPAKELLSRPVAAVAGLWWD
jgi:hypothetical protein